MSKKYDVAVIGGGLSGLCQALLLAQEDIAVVCIDKDASLLQLERNFDTRTTAISWGSRNVLKRIGVWPLIEDKACPINDIKIKDGSSPFVLSFLSEEVENKDFGWIFDNYDLRLALHKRAAEQDNLVHETGVEVETFHVKHSHVEVIAGNEKTYDASLAIGCDGRKSKMREFMNIGTWGHEYGQTAIVCLVTHEKPHNNIAIEHFLPEGPFASLPMTDDEQGRSRSAIVWSIHGSDSAKYLHSDEAVFNAHINRLYDGVFGEAKLSGKRAGWPLNIVMAYDYIRPRMVIMAEAAHGIHPIAGQGLNLSLRDCAAMTEILIKAKAAGQKDFGDYGLLKEYQKARRIDNTLMGLAMEGFNQIFSNNKKVPRIFRRTGLRIISRIPAFKKFFMTQAMGTAGFAPEMVKRDEISN
jgi:2-octaprenyl-6-methoxyphenol hydroxylase